MKKKSKPFFKRVEINFALFSKKIRLRLARTTFPKPSLSWHPFRGFSLNSAHGARISKSFKGITLGFQNFDFVFRGRWSSSLFGLNLNMSKSGFSLSQTNILGTYNFSNPNRSSANILGVQIRGKKAAEWALFGLIISLPFYFLKLLILLIKLVLMLSQILVLLFIWTLKLTFALFLFFASSIWYLFIASICLVTPDSWINGG
jgi:hypothetical protein